MGNFRAVLPPASGVSRAGPAGGRNRARLCRAGVNIGVGTICRYDWPDYRHGNIWRFSAFEGTAAEIRFYSRVRRRCCPRSSPSSAVGAVYDRALFLGFEKRAVIDRAYRSTSRGGESMRIVIGADHAGYPLKKALADYIRRLGHDVVDVGTNSTEPVDYPDYAEAVSKTLTEAKADRGVLI